MVTVNIHEAKAKLSHYISLAEKGERVVFCRRNVPIVELTPTKKKRQKRKFGGYEGKIKIHPSFFDPMSEEELSEWYDISPSDPLHEDYTP